MPETTIKPFWQSKGIMGALAVIIVGLILGGSLVKGTFGDKDDVELTYENWQQSIEVVQAERVQVGELLTATVTLIGGWVALIGRVKANSDVVFKKPKPV